MVVVRTAEYRVSPEGVEQARMAVRALVRAVARNEPGTIAYDALQHAGDPTRFRHTMVFRNAQAEDAHRLSPHCQRFVLAVYPLCSEGPVFGDALVVASRRPN